MNRGLLAILAVAFTALSIGSGVRWLLLRHRFRERQSDPLRRNNGAADSDANAPSSSAREQSSSAREHWSRLQVWWLLLTLFAAALLAGTPGLAIMFGVASLIGLYEFHRMFIVRTLDSLPLLSLIALIGIAHYVALAGGSRSWIMPSTCLSLFVTICLVQIGLGRTHDYLRTTAGYFWGAILLIVGLSHVVALSSLPASTHDWSAGPLGWTVYVVLLTESNDIAQALMGRAFGQHKIIPAVSPGKSWEGLLAGLFVTCLLAACLAGPLTTLVQHDSQATGWLQAGWLKALLSGVLISLAGFVGDLNISALKREAGIKDSSRLLPGMGGMLDRIDSLSFTAPALFYYAKTFG